MSFTIKCTKCQYTRKNLGRLGAETAAIKHSIAKYHPVSVTNEQMKTTVTLGEDRTIPMFGDDPPF